MYITDSVGVCRDRTGPMPLARPDPYEPSHNGKIRCTVVPWLSLLRSTWPPSFSAVDQPVAEPGIGPSRIEPLAVVGDRQAKFPGQPL